MRSELKYVILTWIEKKAIGLSFKIKQKKVKNKKKCWSNTLIWIVIKLSQPISEFIKFKIHPDKCADSVLI